MYNQSKPPAWNCKYPFFPKIANLEYCNSTRACNHWAFYEHIFMAVFIPFFGPLFFLEPCLLFSPSKVSLNFLSCGGNNIISCHQIHIYVCIISIIYCIKWKVSIKFKLWNVFFNLSHIIQQKPLFHRLNHFF